MKSIREIKIKQTGRSLKTEGLKKNIGFEIDLLIQNKEERDYLNLLSFLIDYFIDSKATIKDGQTIAYYSWLLKFVIGENFVLSIYEVNSNGDGFTEGANYAIEVVNEQTLECVKIDRIPVFPTFSQMIVVSKGVFSGEEINAVRYPSPGHMTGWWLTTDLYDGNINSLETIHYYHFAFQRPDIIKYLALPPGFRFFSGNQSEVWFDKDALS